MKKSILFFGIATLAFSAKINAQIGVNTQDPASTLDITAKRTTGTSTNVDGLLIPRIDRQRAQSMASVPVSTLIYVNSITTGTQTGTAVNIDAVGYYYFDGTNWAKLTPNIYNSDGSLKENRTVTQGNNTLAFKASSVNAFSVNNTFSVDAANNRVGIGTISPSATLEINPNIANNSGLKFSKLNSSTPVGIGQAIGVDNNGNVITLPNPTAANVTAVLNTSINDTGGPASNANNFTVNDNGWTIVPSTSQTMTIPAGGKAIFVNFMLGIDYLNNPPGSGYSYYTSKLFIDGVETKVFLTTQEPGPGGLQAQFTLSSVSFFSPGTHTIDIRMKRTFNNGTSPGSNMSCGVMSMSINASYIN
ncbi:MAG: hypothetical protein MUW56_16020 [Chryseobacterium sp.]|uniref:hypothetical protein n=1 Tax=Chryseobacterium sp. TaxID=1871047 RepID=UPI0025C5498E|nr:hypothetical protein [Chryseobacterium sp.]MCJ7935080.1 hypothetical protein [Chryseobacterium sp.]